MFKDARGQGNYDIFPDMKEGQINISTTYPGVIRAFHRHRKQWDNWYIVAGQFEIVLANDDDDYRVEYLGPGESVKIPPFVWHGFKVLGTEPGTLLYWVTNKFDPDDPDEERNIWNRWYEWKTEFK